MENEEIKKYSVSLLRKIADHLENEEFEEIQKHLGTSSIGDGYDCSYFINYDLGENVSVLGQNFTIQNSIQDIIEKLKQK